MASDEASGWLQTVVPFLPLGGVVLGALIIEGARIYNRKRGALETRAPDVTEIWAHAEKTNRLLDAERAYRRMLLGLAEAVQDAFRGFIRRVHSGGSTDLTEKERAMRDLAFPPPPKIEDDQPKEK